ERGGAHVDLHRLPERRLELARERDQRRDRPAHEAQDRDVGEPESPDPGRRQDGRKAKRLHDRVTCDPMTGTEHSEAVDALVDVGGVRLHTRRVGTGPPVVVLHGGPGADYAYLLPQYDRLAVQRSEEHTSELQSPYDLV